MASNKSEKNSGNQGAGLLGIKELSITPVITSLLKPTSDLVGIELRDYVKEKIDNIKKKKRVENVAGHIHHAQGVLQKERKEEIGGTEKIQQLELFGDWVKGAQDIDPEDSILGRLWQNLLVDILKESRIDKVIIEKLESITTQEALLLLKIYKKGYISGPNEKEKYFLSRLETIGTVVSEKNELFIIRVLKRIPQCHTKTIA